MFLNDEDCLNGDYQSGQANFYDVIHPNLTFHVPHLVWCMHDSSPPQSEWIQDLELEPFAFPI